ncbi:hypothetical protein EVAR_71165_1 [Eumeta japonica]|uniref:Heme-binding protein n=1 Tax=Eumeta variegata TaxID=151549 RepID=A0A4C1SPE0_EUMVA|nr:hypothetical protein EVAR_71165_1 [Eumeta japonica]
MPHFRTLVPAAAVIALGGVLALAVSASALRRPRRTAQVALARCAADDLGSVSVAVVDRQGELQAFVRGDNAAQHTVDASRQKAYTAAAFGADTSDLVERADENGLHRLPGTLFMPGGVTVTAGDASIAGIGVGGAPRAWTTSPARPPGSTRSPTRSRG